MRTDGLDAVPRLGAPSSTVDELAEEMQSQIISGELLIGSWLRQETLADRFGVSRTPIREALRKLQATNFVELVPNRGAVVRMPSAREIRETFLVRAELEGLTAELAAGTAQSNDVKQLWAAHDAFAASVEEVDRLEDEYAAAQGWMRAHNGFHDVLSAIAGNETLGKVVHELHGRSPRSLVWSALRAVPDGLTDNRERHTRIVQVVEDRRPLEARALMRDLILENGDQIARFLPR